MLYFASFLDERVIVETLGCDLVATPPLFTRGEILKIMSTIQLPGVSQALRWGWGRGCYRRGVVGVSLRKQLGECS